MRLATESDVTPDALAPVLGDRLRRRRDRPQRPDHELLEDAAAAREARHGVQHRQRLRADRRLPRRQARLTASRSPRRSRSSIQDLDGTFSFLVSTKDEIGYAKDNLAAKPMVMYEDENLVAIASEEVSLNRLFPGRSLATSEPAARHLPHVATIDLAARLGHRRQPPAARVRQPPARTSTSSTRTRATTSASASPTRSRSASAARPATSARA